MNRSAVEPSLEVIYFELHLSTADIIGEGFEMAVLNSLEKIGGTLLFNLRLEDDPLYQRCAAAILGERPDQTVEVARENWTGVVSGIFA